MSENSIIRTCFNLLRANIRQGDHARDTRLRNDCSKCVEIEEAARNVKGGAKARVKECSPRSDKRRGAGCRFRYGQLVPAN